jgi:hypothetical protein
MDVTWPNLILSRIVSTIVQAAGSSHRRITDRGQISVPLLILHSPTGKDLNSFGLVDRVFMSVGHNKKIPEFDSMNGNLLTSLNLLLLLM